jgi:hypothetical protein
MITVNGESFYIDVDVLDQILNDDETLKAGYTTNTKTVSTYKGDGSVEGTIIEDEKVYKPREVDGFKYELYMNLIQMVLQTPLENEDSQLPMDWESVPQNVLLAFNTLMHKQIIKRI